MTILKTQPAITLAAACALSLFSAASFAAGRAPATSATMQPGAGRDAAVAHMSTRPIASTSMPATRPTAAAKSTTTAKAATTHRTGQPNASCEETPNQPGHSISAPGSAFNPDGVAGTKYAGEQPQNSRNPKSVSQYDVACARPTH